MRCRYVVADYKHEASRGLSATTELLVNFIAAATNVNQFLYLADSIMSHLDASPTYCSCTVLGETRQLHINNFSDESYTLHYPHNRSAVKPQYQ